MMLKKSDPVALTAIDYNSLDESEDNHEAVEFDILLNYAPETKWCEEFEIAYRTIPNNIKPPVHVTDDRMRIAFLPRYERDLQGYLEFVKTVVERANEEVRKTESIIQHGHRTEHIDAFREVLHRVRLDAQ